MHEEKKKLDALCFSIPVPSVTQSGPSVHALVTGPSTLLHVSADADKPTNETLNRHVATEQTSWNQRSFLILDSLSILL
jgi:CRISPR/Cas system CMR subunit Cmr4 (Cas7 group RAMP superfamily)